MGNLPHHIPFNDVDLSQFLFILIIEQISFLIDSTFQTLQI